MAIDSKILDRAPQSKTVRYKSREGPYPAHLGRPCKEFGFDSETSGKPLEEF